MGIVRKLWNMTPAVVAGKKLHQAALNKQQQKAQQPKPDKTYSLGGAYYSSHPAIHGYKALKLDFSDAGVTVVAKRQVVKTFAWDEIIGYANETEDKTNLQTSQRVTATRLVAGGVFAFAAPKKSTSGNIKSKFYDVLHTTTGDIELDAEIDSGGASGSIGDISRGMAGLMIKRREANTKEVRRFVAEHATGSAPAPQADDPAEQVRKLAELKNQGYLTQQEFDTKKKQLLGL